MASHYVNINSSARWEEDPIKMAKAMDYWAGDRPQDYDNADYRLSKGYDKYQEVPDGWDKIWDEDRWGKYVYPIKIHPVDDGNNDFKLIPPVPAKKKEAIIDFEKMLYSTKIKNKKKLEAIRERIAKLIETTELDGDVVSYIPAEKAEQVIKIIIEVMEDVSI